MGACAAARWPNSDLALTSPARNLERMRLNQVTAPAHDLARSIAFYEILGLKLIVRSDHYARFELPRGEATFSLHVVEGDIPRKNAPQIYFEVHDVEIKMRALKLAGVEIDQDTKHQSWLWTEAWIRDPAGNALCIFNAGDNRRYPPWRLDPKSGQDNLHLVIRDGEQWAIVRNNEDDWRALQDKYGDYKASLGPFDLYGLLALMEFEWPDIFLAHEEKIRAFAASDDIALDF